MNAGEDVNVKEIIANDPITQAAAILSQHSREKGRSL